MKLFHIIAVTKGGEITVAESKLLRSAPHNSVSDVIDKLCEILVPFSSLSSQLCASTTLFHHHFIKSFFPNLSDMKMTIIAKMVCFLYGSVSVLFVLMVRYLGTGLLSVSMPKSLYTHASTKFSNKTTYLHLLLGKANWN